MTKDNQDLTKNLNEQKSQENEEQKNNCCGNWSCLCVLKNLPYLSAIVGVIAVIGLILWSVNAKDAIIATQEILQIISGNSNGFENFVNGFIATIVFTAIILISVLTLIFIFAILRFDMKARKEGMYGGSGACCASIHTFYHVLYGIVIGVLYLLVLWFVIMIAIYVTWLVGMVVVEKGAAEGQVVITQGIQQAKQIQYRADDLIENVQSVISKIEDAIQQDSTKVQILKLQNELRNSSHETKLKQAIQQIQSYNASAQTGVCPATVCLDLTSYQFFGSNACICNPVKIEAIQQFAGICASNLLPSIVGLILLYISGSLLLMKLMADRTHLVRDAQVVIQRRIQSA